MQGQTACRESDERSVEFRTSYCSKQTSELRTVSIRTKSFSIFRIRSFTRYKARLSCSTLTNSQFFNSIFFLLRNIAFSKVQKNAIFSVSIFSRFFDIFFSLLYLLSILPHAIKTNGKEGKYRNIRNYRICFVFYDCCLLLLSILYVFEAESERFFEARFIGRISREGKRDCLCTMRYVVRNE